jgi:carbon storage regulator CsrA
MLVLSRKAEESVVVGGANIFGRVLKVTVLEIKGGHVKLGFEANEDVPIQRVESVETSPRQWPARIARDIRTQQRTAAHRAVEDTDPNPGDAVGLRREGVIRMP